MMSRWIFAASGFGWRQRGLPYLRRRHLDLAVLALHCVLLPISLYRLFELHRAGRCQRASHSPNSPNSPNSQNLHTRRTDIPQRTHGAARAFHFSQCPRRAGGADVGLEGDAVDHRNDVGDRPMYFLTSGSATASASWLGLESGNARHWANACWTVWACALSPFSASVIRYGS